MNLTKKYVLFMFALFLPLYANACDGGSQPGDIFVILLPIAIILFLFINRRYFFLIFKDKKIMLLTFIPLLVIGMIIVYKFIETKKESDIENQKIIECQLKNDKILKEQNLNEILQWGAITRPCGVPTDRRSNILDISMFILSFLFCYSIFMMLYGIYEIKKKNDIGKKILKFSISLILLAIFAYISLIAMSTVLLC